MATINLGKVRDKITSIEWTSNSDGMSQGTAGTDDTYTVYTEQSPGGAGTFTVHNGADASILLVSGSYSSIKDGINACATALFDLSGSSLYDTTAYTTLSNGDVLYCDFASPYFDGVLFRCGRLSGYAKLDGYGGVGLFIDQKIYDLGSFSTAGAGFIQAKSLYASIYGSGTSDTTSRVLMRFHCTADGGSDWIITSSDTSHELQGIHSAKGNFIARNISEYADTNPDSVWVAHFGKPVVEFGPYSTTSDALAGLLAAFPDKSVNIVGGHCYVATTVGGGGQEYQNRQAFVNVTFGNNVGSAASSMTVKVLDSSGNWVDWSSAYGNLYIDVAM